MVVIPPLPLSPHVELAIPAELITNEDPLGISLKTPRVVRKGAKIEGVELIGARIAKEGKLQLRRAVGLAKKETECVLGVAGTAGKTSTDSNPCIGLKTLGSIRKHQFQRTGSFPVPPILSRVGVDARGRIEEVF